MSHDDEAVAQARAVYHQMQNDALARTPLAQAADWVGSGRAPPADVLRRAGFDGAERADIDAMRLARRAFVRRFGLAIPCAELTQALLPLSPLLEIGSGTGYLSALLRAAGANVVATDPGVADGVAKAFGTPVFTRIEPLDGAAAVRAYPEHNVLCAWPTEGSPWAFEAAREIAPGRRLAVILDARGITGDPALLDLLRTGFDVEEDIELPQFPNVQDRLTLYRRR